MGQPMDGSAAQSRASAAPAVPQPSRTCHAGGRAAAQAQADLAESALRGTLLDAASYGSRAGSATVTPSHNFEIGRWPATAQLDEIIESPTLAGCPAS